jgi:hypothetical protein
MNNPTARDPITEEWLEPGVPFDHVGRLTRLCSAEGTETVQDLYRVVIGAYGGFGAPRFLRGFLKRQSTRGKIGRRSQWFVCSACGGMMPADETARQQAAEFGSPEGFFHQATPGEALATLQAGFARMVETARRMGMQEGSRVELIDDSPYPPQIGFTKGMRGTVSSLETGVFVLWDSERAQGETEGRSVLPETLRLLQS